MYTIGIDLGGTNISAGLVRDGKVIVARANTPTAMPRGAQAIADDMALSAVRAAKAGGLELDEVENIGIGVPGSADTNKGLVKYANNLNFNNVPLGDMMSGRLGRPIYIENDANAAAMGEFAAGAAMGCSSVIMITLGTGIGAGILTDGHIVRGLNFSAGEIGHTVIELDGAPCTCGRRGCWEAYASVSAFIRQTREAMSAAPESLMWEEARGSLDNVNGKTAFDAMRRGDAAAGKVVGKYIDYVGTGLVNIINIFDPEIVLIGGGISKEGDVLLEPLRQTVARESYSRHSELQPKIVAAALGNDAGIIGAAILGRGF